MENNLTLEEVSPYFPFNLNFVLTHDKTNDFCDEDWYEEEKFKKGAIWQLCGYAPSDLNIYIGEGTIDGFLYRNDMTYVNFNKGIKPLLRPLSDLTKEIEVDGEKFVPIKWLKENYTDHKLKFEFPDYIILYDNYSLEQNVLGAPMAIIQQLFKWHFDVFSLIEKEKAININTINLK